MTATRSWIAVSSMFILNGALFGIWASRIPAFVQQLDLSHADLGWILLAMAAGAVCSFPLAGKYVDWLGAACVTRIIALFYPITLILLPLAPNAGALAPLLFLFGAAHGAMDVAMNSWGAEVERRFERRMMSSFHATFSFGAGIGALSGYLAILSHVGPMMHFVVAAAAVSSVTMVLANVSWKSARLTETSGSIFAFPTGPLLVVGIVAFCASLGEGAMADWSAVYLRDVARADESTAALGYAVFSVAMVLMRLCGDWITMRLGATIAARTGGIVAFIGILLAVGLPSVETALIGFSMMGLGYAVVMPLAFSRAANDPNMPPGRAIASVATLGYGGMLLGPPAIGFLASVTTLQLAFVMLAILAGVIVAAASSLQ